MRRRMFFLLFLLPLGLVAQEKATLFGYVESQFMAARIAGTTAQLFSNKLRLDLSGQLGSVDYGANINFITYHGQTTWPLLDLLPSSVRGQAVSLDLMGQEIDFYQLPFEDRQELDNAFIRLSLAGLDLTLGKQQLSFGTGYAWNPTDLFNTKDLMDPAYEQPGHAALRVDWPLSSRTLLTAVCAPENEWEASTKLVRLKTTLGRFDVAVLAAAAAWQPRDYTQFNGDLLAPDFVVVQDRRKMVGVNLAGELLGLGVWAEAVAHRMDVAEDYEDWLLGLDYTFPGGTYVMAEAYRSGLGRARSTDYTLNDWMRFLAGEQKAMARDQLYALALFPAGDFVKWGVSAIAVLSDGSAALLPTLQWSAGENLEITAYGNVYLGGANDAYHANLGNGGLVRARVYF